MAWRLIRTILILPGTALGLIPGLILWLSHGTRLEWSPAPVTTVQFWLGCLALAAGLALAVWTVRLFTTVGQGTPAPWDPPQAFVVVGPYAHVRNPMISSVVVMLAGEALVFGSWPIVGWAAVFFLINCVYFPMVEEPGLERRFGDDYRRYKEKVPRWVPRLTPYRPERETAQALAGDEPNL